MRRTFRTFAAIAFVALILVGLVPPAPSLASHGVDLVNAAPTGWVSTAGGVTCPVSGRSCDGNDGTGERHDGHCGSQDVGRGTHNYCTGYVQFTRSSGVTTFDLSSMRMLAKTCQTGDGSSCGGATLDMTSVVVQELISGTCSGTAPELGYASQSASATFETGEIEIDTVTIANNEGLCFFVEVVAMNTVQWFTVSTISAYTENLGPESVDITEYLYGLRLDHPPFERVIYWEWAKDDCGGSWSIVDEDDDVFGGDFLNCAGDFIGQYERFTIPCPVVCGHDVYTITINDTTNNRVATYDIDSDESGELIADSTPPRITSFNVCYNASTDQCVTARPDLWTAQAAGNLQTSYSFTGDPANVTFGHDDPTAGLWAFAGTPDTISAQTAGYYRRTYTSVDTDLSPTFNLYLENFATEYAWLQATVDYGAGGSVEVLPPDPDPDEGEIRDCTGQGALSLELVACRLGQLIDILGGISAGVINDLWGPSIGAVRAAASEKLPFAYIVLAVDGVSSQISRMSDEVENSDDCDGITLPVPLYYGMSPTTPTPTTLPITVLTCAQLEPFMGTEWYQAIRTALDPALWLLFGWSQFKALQPKTSLNG